MSNKIDIPLNPDDLKDIDKLMSLMKTISKHKVDYSDRQSKPKQYRNEIELAQLKLSEVFKIITEFRIKNSRLFIVNQEQVNKAHSTAVDLSIILQEIKKAYLYNEKK